MILPQKIMQNKISEKARKKLLQKSFKLVI